jgi:putative long chain acyl-CoA synthase
MAMVTKRRRPAAAEANEGTQGKDEPSRNGMMGLLGRLSSALGNAAELAQFGQLGQTARTPYDVVLREPIFRLRHYRGAATTDGRRPSILLVPPLMITAEVYDIAAQGSAVAALLELGVDPWVVDFGAPERQEGGLRRTLTDHVLAVSRAVDRVSEEVGHDVHLAGYSQGGMFCYQAAAYRRSQGLASVIAFGSPVDVRQQALPAIPEAVAVRVAGTLGRLVSASVARSALPAWVSRTMFRLISPTKEIRGQLEFLTGLHDREALLRREGQRRFLAREGWVAWPGPALGEFVEQFLVHNRMLSGGFVIGGRTLTLADITCPVLTFVGLTDEIARPEAVRSIRQAAPRAEIYEVSLRAGHFGLVVGSTAMRESWPLVAGWVRWRAGLVRRPKQIVAAGEVKRPPRPKREPSPGSLLAELGRSALSVVGDALGENAGALRGLASSVINQLPLVARLQRVRRDTRIGLGLMLAERVAAAPDGTFFLFQGRAYTYAEANRRVDAVVRGLISIGVRQGDHVGLYMDSRPSALALTTAISRLGAVGVLLRPDGDLQQELALGEVEFLITDPERGEYARSVWDRTVYVLGGGGGPRKLAAGLFDMEAIDPDRVAVPEWYEPDPGRSEDLAFILFSGRGENTHANRITNRRWALAAFGAASAGAMSASDTVYCWTPIYHPTGLLVSMGAPVVVGARMAIADEFSAATFWKEVRQYGATVVFYAGTVCRELVDAPYDPAERNHPVRLFAGSGMPRPLWRRVVERFGPLTVCEFYATTEGNAILANVSGAKIGSVGRPIPGSARVALAAYDARMKTLLREASGYCRRVPSGQTGLLLAEVDRERGVMIGKPLRSVFERGDAWYATNFLLRRDEDGDYWRVDNLNDVIQHADGPLPTIPIKDAAWEVEGVSAAAAYGVQLPNVAFEIPVVAVSLQAGATLDLEALHESVERELEPSSRPLVVRVVKELPMTAGYRLRHQPLRDAGVDPREIKDPMFWYDRTRGTYQPMDMAAYDRLCTSLAAGRAPRRRAKVKAARRRRPRPAAR